MKYNIKHLLCTILIAIMAMSLFSCSDSDSLDVYGQISPPDEKFDAKIYFVSKLNDAPIATAPAEQAAITSFFKNKKGKMGKNAFLGIIDRADAIYSPTNMANGSIRTAFEADYCSAFALNRVNGTTYEGSTLLFDYYIKEQQSVKVTNDCYVKVINARLYGTNSELEKNVDFSMQLRTARFSTQDQVKAFTESVFGNLKSQRINMFMIGTVKKDLAQSLKSGVEEVDGNYKMTIVPETESSDYSIFMLAHEQFWVLKGATKQSLGNSIDVYELSIMW